MDLTTSLSKYNQHLQILLNDPETFERFKTLSQYDSLGCFCDPKSSCHIDTIRYYLRHLGLKVPNRQCVKAKWLRKQTDCDNLDEWLSNPQNCLCTRRGRIFIGSKKQDNHRIYHYGESEWANPYKVTNKVTNK